MFTTSVCNYGLWNVTEKFGSPVACGECEWMKESNTSEHDCKRRVSDLQRLCSLCKEHLRDAHSHPGQWKSELQQFLLTYSKRSVSSCLLDVKFKGEFIPRWIKCGLKIQNQCCCVPGCGKTSERRCVCWFWHCMWGSKRECELGGSYSSCMCLSSVFSTLYDI